MSSSAAKSFDTLPKMNVKEFMQWYETQEGRWELHNGIPVRKHDPITGQSERFGHLRTKSEIYLALREAIQKAKLKCEAISDGATVNIDDEVSYEPDALVYCGERIDNNELSVPNPVIIVEVLSPSTAYKDISEKLEDYFKLPSVGHYLILDPRNGHITHHYRDGDQVAMQAVTGKTLQLTPPNMTLDLTALFS